MKNILTYHGNEISIISINIRTLNAFFCRCVVRMSINIYYYKRFFNEYFSETLISVFFRKVYIFRCARSSSLFIFLDYTYRQFVFVDVFFPVTLDDMRLLASATHTSVSFSLSNVFERILVFSISRLCFDRQLNILRTF